MHKSNTLFLSLLLTLFFLPLNSFSNEATTDCEYEAYKFLMPIIGTWHVSTKDRTSPGEYEENKGQSVIYKSINGCGVKESFEGTFRSKKYAREVLLFAKGSDEIEMMAFDSEHSSFSTLNGGIKEGKLIVYWYRDKTIKRLQSKYILEIKEANEFDFSSFLSTDHGANWALTHQRKYSRIIEKENAIDNDTMNVQHLLTAYYDCISGPIGEVRDFDRLRSLFHPEARLIYSHWDEEIKKASLMIFTVEEFIGKLGYLDKKGFYEEEISNQVHSFGSVIQVFSTYQFRAEDKSIPNGRGITSYELFFDGNRYWIMSMFWNAENAKYVIPEKYLK